jgi:prophage DNA circulation protein
MTIIRALRDRLSRRNASADPPKPRSGTSAGSAEEVDLPFAGYDRLAEKRVVEGLADHSQVELEAVESYERSHQDRQSVLDKLRYMRGREPLPRYDALSVEEIVAALAEADLATIKKVRAYERKFANRREVLEEVARVNHRRQASQPASAAPAYQPASRRTVPGPHGDRTGKSGRKSGRP